MKTFNNALLFIIFMIVCQVSLAQRLTYKTSGIGNSWIGLPGKHMQNHIENMTVSADGTCSTSSRWDEGGHPNGKYKNGSYIGNSSGADSRKVTDKWGKTWSIENYYGRFLNAYENHGRNATTTWRIDPVPTGSNAPYIKCSDGRLIRDIPDPSAIGIDYKTGHLLVADNGPEQNIKIFNIEGTSKSVVDTFGVPYGIYAGPDPGLMDSPLKFYGITGVGGDADGNIYVASDGFPATEGCGGGADLRSLKPDGTLNWRMTGLLFLVSGVFDPATDGTDIITPFYRFRMDYTRESQLMNGPDWQSVSYSLNPFKYPNDPRLVHSTEATIGYKKINGTEYLFLSDMYMMTMNVYRMDGHIAVPCAVICAGFGWNGDEYSKFIWMYKKGRPAFPRWIWADKNGDGNAQADEFETFEMLDRNIGGLDVDNQGNVYLGTANHIWKFPTNGFDTYGNPKYTAASMKDVGTNAFSVSSTMKYIDEKDMMVYGSFGMKSISVFENWSDSVNRKMVRSIPIPAASGLGGDPCNVTADEDFAYVSYSIIGGPNTKKEGEVIVFRLADGKQMGYLTPGPEVESKSGWIDMSNPTHAFKRSNGEHVIAVEEDLVGKLLVYQWKPELKHIEYVSVVAPFNKSVQSYTAGIPIRVAANYTTKPIGKIQVMEKSQGLLGEFTADPYALNWHPGAKGTYKLYAKMLGTDNAVLLTSDTILITLGDLPPTATIISPVNEQGFKAPANVTVKLKASDIEGSIKQLDLYQGNTIIKTWNAPITSDSIYQFELKDLSRGKYSIKVKATDDQNNSAFSAVATIGVGPGEGKVTYQYWKNVAPNGTDQVYEVTRDPRYPNNPDGGSELTRFDAPRNWFEAGGERIRGYLYPPVTGNYTFYITSDDAGELWLSTDSTLEKKELLCIVPHWAMEDNFSDPKQKSAPVALEAGKRYFIEAVMREKGGGDHLTVAWEFPGQARETIDGIYLAPCYLPEVKVESISIEQNSLTIPQGKCDTAIALVLPENATTRKIAWTSLNPALASVDQNGRVCGLSAGNTTIKATTLDNQYVASIPVTILSTSGLEGDKKEDDFSVYPNPNKSKILHVKLPAASTHLHIYTASGIHVYERHDPPRELCLPTEQFEPGVYIVEVRTATNTRNLKLIVN